MSPPPPPTYLKNGSKYEGQIWYTYCSTYLGCKSKKDLICWLVRCHGNRMFRTTVLLFKFCLGFFDVCRNKTSQKFFQKLSCIKTALYYHISSEIYSNTFKGLLYLLYIKVGKGKILLVLLNSKKSYPEKTRRGLLQSPLPPPACEG